MTLTSAEIASHPRPSLSGIETRGVPAGVPSSFAAFSDSIARLVSAAAPNLAAIRTGPNLHVTGLLWQDKVITTDQALPVQDHYTIVLPAGKLVSGKPGQRNRAAAILRLDAPAGPIPLALAQPVLGGFAVVLAADAQAAPTVRLTTVHRLVVEDDSTAAVLDLAPHQVDPGGLALDAQGRLIGLVAVGPAGEAVLVAPSAISRIIQSAERRAAESADAEQPPVTSRRGWLGVALQPICVPEPLATRAGQTSARMIVKITTGGPADRGGLHVGDVLLTLNDVSVTGTHSLRAFLDGAKIGCPVNARLLRDGNLFTAQLIVAAHPG
jgi:hypothetical protein